MRIPLGVIALIWTVAAHGQSVQVQPANPTSADVIAVRVGVPLIGPEPMPVIVVGSEIRLTMRGQGFEEQIGTSHTFSIGRLPAGTYQVIARIEYTDGLGTVINTFVHTPYTIVVSQAVFPVPALQTGALVALATAIAGGGVLLLRR